MSIRYKKNIEITVLCIIIFLGIFIAKYPTLHNAINTPPGLFFTNQVSWFDAWDINAYVSYIRYGQKNGVLLQNTYTTESHQGVFVFQTYTLLGILNRYLHLEPFLLFHIASTLVNIGLILMIYYTLGIVFQSRLERLSSLIIIVLGAGLGWIKDLTFAADYRLAGFTLVDQFERPHNALTTLFVIGQVAFLAQYVLLGRSKYLYLSLLSAFLSFTIHPPFALFSLIIFTAAFILFKKNINIKNYLRGLFFLCSAYGIYFISLLKPFLNNPGFRNIGGQAFWYPDFPTVILGFGLLTIGIIYSFIFKTGKLVINLIKIIFSVQILLLFSPLVFKFYFAKGIFIWGVILGIYGFTKLTGPQLSRYVLIALMLIALPLRLYIFTTLANADHNIQFYFLDSREGHALKFMSNLPQGSAILSLYRIGNNIPAFTDNIVYLGHLFQTPDYPQKLKLAEKFYLTDDDDYKKSILKENKIKYVYVGFEEQLLRKNNNLSPFMAFEGLEKIYKDSYIEIYKFQ